ncbi:hypothetical protein [Microcoleus sp. FACHB-672]|uniref:hypothetical protein n=1 Tax=Microcoleus sp. FACHB-672 TaxID=2692825 RepID=UPI0016839FA9|nr:hypothetical protein [Microcoleus sp. FACHB-672]MBD2039510.1 hypothetical protein [Microcoleus sp. FACHB-672]
MPLTDDIASLRQFRQGLEPHGIEIWSSSESLPEEVLQQFIRSDEDTTIPADAHAEELHPQQRIDELSADTPETQISHFIDGSPRTVNVGFLLGANGVSYPVGLSHVGAVAVSFDNGRWQETGFNNRHMILASVQQGMGINLQVSGTFKLEDPTDKLSGNRQIDPTDMVEMRNAAIRRARRRMRICERELVRELSNSYPDNWTAADGTLFDIDAYNNNMRDIQVVGISKSFTLNPIVERNSTRERIGYLVGILTNLPVGWRSPVYKLTPEINRLDKYTYMWFIRLHNARQSPVSGIIKVELPPSNVYLDSTLRLKTVNALSHKLFRLRTPYLYDNRRGESFLYPIYVAETLIKSKLKSVDKLRGIWESSQY